MQHIVEDEFDRCIYDLLGVGHDTILCQQLAPIKLDVLTVEPITTITPTIPTMRTSTMPLHHTPPPRQPHMNNIAEKMVLNPDAMVALTRSNGKMSQYCVQRVQYGRDRSKKAGHPVKDGAINTLVHKLRQPMLITL